MDEGIHEREPFSPLEIPKLVGPLGEDSERVFEKRYNNEEAADGRKMGAKWLGVDVNPVLDFRRK